MARIIFPKQKWEFWIVRCAEQSGQYRTNLLLVSFVKDLLVRSFLFEPFNRVKPKIYRWRFFATDRSDKTGGDAYGLKNQSRQRIANQ